MKIKLNSQMFHSEKKESILKIINDCKVKDSSSKNKAVRKKKFISFSMHAFLYSPDCSIEMFTNKREIWLRTTQKQNCSRASPALHFYEYKPYMRVD